MTNYRPLNVKDALSYLDQVKVQFQSQPEVYNHFLDIMKDFKSQSIDTPGVIDRVSTLFAGHPNLIQGFNTFLPPGYRIECSMDPNDPNPIRVTTPMGTTTRPEGAWSMGQQPSNQYISQDQQGMAHLQTAAMNGRNFQDAGYFNQEGARINQENPMAQQQQQVGSPIEFNHAISYVNKIKTRFANQPDIYKHFLEILQTYQRDQKSIGEVYEQVTVLFQNAPDLLDDFKQFLPDTSGNQQWESQQFYEKPKNGMQLPPVGSFHPHSYGAGLAQQATAITGGERRKRRQGSYEMTEQAPVSSMREAAPVKRYRNKPASPSLLPGIPEPVHSYAPDSNLVEELSFFDKVKKVISNKQTYNEFLKILNLYSQDIIDKDTLVERVNCFIGGYTELFEWFKSFVGYDNKPQNIESIVFKKHQLELSLCKACGPSYRLLPKAETYMPCSGRDEMCWEVLNDEWVGHPTWASEESGFIAHRKNQYEEILFRIEEERHEYDFYTEANLRTIQTLETIANRIANMSPEEKASFKLPPGLGHTSVTIYKKVIRKVYDKDRGFEVIDALHENPVVAVPIVLKRLKQKDEEWRRSHREWNKVWREMEQKVFYKSLDHLGLTFKQADKKLLTSKRLVSEISTIKMEQNQKRMNPLTPKPVEQLNYSFQDLDILVDVIALVVEFVNHCSTYSQGDKERLESFIRLFTSRFFMLSDELVSPVEEPPREVESKEEIPKSLSFQRKRNRDQDLLKDVLRRNNKMAKRREEGNSDSEMSESTAEDNYDDTDLEVERAGRPWVETLNQRGESVVDSSQVIPKRSIYNCFCNTNIYVFFRYVQILYERLEEVKLMSVEANEEIKSRKDVQFAKDLDLISHQLEDMNINITGDDSYAQVLALCKKLIDGSLEHQWFEESLRQGFRNKAYKLFTVDKVVQGLTKHMHTIIQDQRTSEMVLLMERDRSQPTSTVKEQILYRFAVRSLMTPEENMFRLQFDNSKNSAVVQYISLDDVTINDGTSPEDEWNYYLTTFVMTNATEGISPSSVRLPFMKPLLEDSDGLTASFAESEMKVKVDMNTFKLFFDYGSYDEFVRESALKKQVVESKDVERFKSILGDGGAMTGKTDAEKTHLKERFANLVNKDIASSKNFSSQKWAVPVKISHTDVTLDADSTIAQDDTYMTADMPRSDTEVSPKIEERLIQRSDSNGGDVNME